MTWGVIAGCAVVTALIKGSGPFALGGRPLPPRVTGIVLLLAPALLAALVVTQTLAHGRHLEVGANTAGVAVAAIAAWRRASILVVVGLAAVVTAVLRAV